MLARVVLRTNRLSSAGPLLNELHWLPVASRIQFKIATLTHKILSTGTPSYLSSLLNHYKPTRQLRSSSSNLLVQPPPKLNSALALFTAAPLIWNGLPADVRSSPSFQTFKKMLKTHYFRSPPTWVTCLSRASDSFRLAHPDPVITTLVGRYMHNWHFSRQCFPSTNFLGQLRWYPESVRWYPTPRDLG